MRPANIHHFIRHWVTHDRCHTTWNKRATDYNISDHKFFNRCVTIRSTNQCSIRKTFIDLHELNLSWPIIQFIGPREQRIDRCHRMLRTLINIIAVEFRYLFFNYKFYNRIRGHDTMIYLIACQRHAELINQFLTMSHDHRRTTA